LSVFALVALPVVPVQAAVTYTVTTTADGSDSDLTDGVCRARRVGCTLRAAIQQAEATPGRDRIAFKIPGTGTRTIRPIGSLPAIFDPVVIDGYTQSGSRRNGLTDGTNAVIRIEIDGSLASGGNGLDVRAGNCLIQGLAINRFSAPGAPGSPTVDGVGILILAGSGNVVQGNFIGTDATGQLPLGNGVGIGVVARSGFSATGNRIGGSDPGQRNLISGNGEGIEVFGGGASSNQIRGNLIGTTASGRTPMGNWTGIGIGGAPRNVIGGRTPAERNVVAASIFAGISIAETRITDRGPGNRIEGNFVGTDVTGTSALPNGTNDNPRLGTSPGIIIRGVGDTVIGGTAEGAGNLISGNVHEGIRAVNVLRTVIQGNLIGTDVTGSLPLGNGEDGLSLEGENHFIGGLALGAGNVVSANGGNGMILAGYGDVVQGNLVGTDVTGSRSLANGEDGIVYSGTDSTIGSSLPGGANVISGNAGSGLHFVNAARIGVHGNRIGVDAAGAQTLGNGLHGVLLGQSTDVLIGGSVTGAGNVISGNGGIGVFIADPASPGNTIQGNEIGTDATGATAVPNRDGITAAAEDTTIGGPGLARNVVSGNSGLGIQLLTSRSTVHGNLIGTDASGFLPLGNGFGGVYVNGDANVIGGTSAGSRNIISANGRFGVHLVGNDHTVQGNLIGVGIEGDPLGNGGDGVSIAAIRTSVGGSVPGAGNIVAFNKEVGVVVLSGVGNHLQGNSIHDNDLLGIDLGDDGVTKNDPEDVDGGPNLLQNFPELTEASSFSGLGITKIQGAIDSTPSTDFQIEFFSNDACDPSEHGEGEVVLGTIVVTTDGVGHADFTASFPVVLPEGVELTATATDIEADNNTSEFSMCRQVILA
jgi:titin